MKKIAVAIISATLATVSSGFALAGETCQCRAGGQYYNTGSIICMGKGENRQIARCEMALNNTSWKMLGEQCPHAFSDPAKTQENVTTWPKGQEMTSNSS